MNAFQRRLIYQLVRKEFPDYRAYGRDQGAYMQVELANSVEEAKVRHDGSYSTAWINT